MGQMGFFDVANRYEGLDTKADPLVKLTAMIPWEDFRPRLEGLWRRSPADKKSPAGRKPLDAVVIFKAIVLRDRLSFMRFLRVGLKDPVPDATTIWVYREQLVQAKVIEQLFAEPRRALAGEVWDQALAMIDQAAADHTELQRPAARLVALVSLATERIDRPLLLTLDNFESLLAGPDTDDPDALGAWRDDEAAALWRGLRDQAEKRLEGRNRRPALRGARGRGAAGGRPQRPRRGAHRGGPSPRRHAPRSIGAGRR